MHLLLFGQHDPDIGALIHDPVFRRTTATLFQNAGSESMATPESVLDRAQRAELFRVDGQRIVPGRRLVVCPAEAEEQLDVFWKSRLDRYAEIAHSTITTLRRTFEETAVAEHFSWSKVEHALAAGCFLDLAMGRAVAVSRQTEYQSGDTVVWAFEQVSTENGFGVQKSQLVEGFFAQLWHHTVRRKALHLSESTILALIRLARGEDGTESPKDLLYLRYLGLYRGEEVRIPAFLEPDTERLVPILVPGGQALVDDAIVPALDDLRNHPWWGPRHHQATYRHAAVRLMLEYGAQRAVDEGWISPFPVGEPPSPAWGRWLWVESPSLKGLVRS